ncbi:MAG: tetratricopeptide repeat protein [Deltaproteobacteria bacterium]|nr:tetratricopeptide repeat protein [Deltaproteobacteria bacterium]
MVGVADLGALEAETDAVLEELESTGRAWVIGDAGTGRRSLVEEVVRRTAGALLVELPELGPDASVHGLVQLAAGVDDAVMRAEVLRDARPMGERGAEVARHLSSAGRVVVLRLPRSWSAVGADDGRRSEGADVQAFRRRAFELIGGVLSVASLRVVLVTAHALSAERIRWDLERWPQHRLGPVAARWDSLRDEGRWGTYADHALALHAAGLRAHVPGVSPIALRLGVGLVGLGEAAHNVAKTLGSAGAERRLLERAESRLGESRSAEARDALLRFALSRFSVSRGDVLRIAAPPDADIPLLTECFGYGEDELRMSEAVRQRLVGLLPGGSRRKGRSPDAARFDDAHLAWARVHERLDGVSSAVQVGAPSALHWLERVHHLAHSGSAGASEWRRLEIAHREQLWDRARALSRVHRQYAEAAALYARCVELDRSDAYSWHYLGFNLERARVDAPRAEAAYEEAVRLDPPNPWWNGRRVRFLIKRSKFGAARAAWGEAVKSVLNDPTGATAAPSLAPAGLDHPGGWPTYHQKGTTADPWLARHLHGQVARDWVDHGRPADASEVLAGVAPQVLAREAELRELEQRVADALEVEALGGAVYPPRFPMASRWQMPAELPERDAELGTLQSWHPARVVSAERDAVTVIAATTEDEPDERRLFERTIEADRWERASDAPAHEAHGWYFIGVYGEGELRVVRSVADDPQFGSDRRRHKVVRQSYASLWTD